MRVTNEGARRLMVLADRLDTVPEERFSMKCWMGTREGGYMLSCGPDDLEHTCGTAGCAVGWATTIPAFHQEGFRWLYGSPNFRGDGGFWAVRQFFGVSHTDAMWLFDAIHDRSPREEAAIIRAFVAEHAPAPLPPPVPVAPAAPRLVRHRRVDRSLSSTPGARG